LVCIVKPRHHAPLPNPLPLKDKNGNPLWEFEVEANVRDLMESCMTKGLSIQFENAHPFEVMGELNLRFHSHIRVERYKLTKSILNCELEEGGCMVVREINFVSLMNQLEDWCFPSSL
jgi:hypothetical protein